MTSNPRYSMIDSMDIRCSRCGYENSPQFRFCGMCGASLRPPEATATDDIHAFVNPPRPEENVEPMPVEPLLAELTAAQKSALQNTATQPSAAEDFQAKFPPRSEDFSALSRQESSPPEPVHGQRTPIPVSGPSFLGLSESSDHGAEYLLEDEPQRGGKITALVFLLLLAAAAGLVWHWRKTGYPWSQPTAGSVAPTPLPSSAPAASTPSEIAPPIASPPKPEKPKTGAGEQPVPTENAQEAAPEVESKQPANHPAAEPSTADARTSSEPTPETRPQASAANPVEKPPAASELRRPTSREARISKPAPPVPTVPDPAQDSLFLQGQKYLYGGAGVAANCARAQQYLTAAANNNNPKAQSTLGTMYATGHCASRDLPLAYRWFARALHADPKNTRLERDVEIMWNQMSPQEKQLALKNQ